LVGNILVLAEQKNGELDNITFELLTKGREIADKLKTKLAVLLLGYNIASLSKSLMDTGVDTILVADHPVLDSDNTELCCKVISDTIRDFKPSLFLLGYTYLGMEVGPAVATRLEVPLISNCVDLELVDEKVTVIHPMYSGTLHAKVEIKGVQPYIISFQKGAFSKKTLPSIPASVLSVPVEIDESTIRSKVIGLLQADSGEIDITKANIIVAVGRGVRDKTNIRLAEELADALGGVAGCSRPIADLGWLPSEIHIGISGKTVAPKVYIACGISGASQHTSGMRDSNTIIAINSDPNAPIFRIAHYGVVGDILKIIPALTQEAQKSA